MQSVSAIDELVIETIEATPFSASQGGFLHNLYAKMITYWKVLQYEVIY
jgi:hypothetical protein